MIDKGPNYCYSNGTFFGMREGEAGNPCRKKLVLVGEHKGEVRPSLSF